MFCFSRSRRWAASCGCSRIRFDSNSMSQRVRVSLSCPARRILTEAPREHRENKCPLKSPFVLCVLVLCTVQYSCMIATRLLRNFSSLCLSTANSLGLGKTGLGGGGQHFVFFFSASPLSDLAQGRVLTYSPLFCYAYSCRGSGRL